MADLPKIPLTPAEIAACAGMAGATPEEIALALELKEFFGAAFVPDRWTLRKIHPPVSRGTKEIA